MRPRHADGERRLKSVLAAAYSLIQLITTALLWAIPAAGYELVLYDGTKSVLLMSMLLTALSAGVIFLKGIPGRWGRVFAAMMPFANALSMPVMILLHETSGLICGLWLTAWTFGAFWKCVPEKRNRMGAACAALMLLPVGAVFFLLMLHPETDMQTGAALLAISMNLLFGFVWLGGGALAVLTSCLNARWQKNLCGVLAFAMFALQLMVFCVLAEVSEHGGPLENAPAVLSAVSPDGQMIAEVVQGGTDGTYLYVRKNTEDIDIGIGLLRSDRRSVHWPHSGSAQIETIAWQDEENILINGSLYPIE